MVQEGTAIFGSLFQFRDGIKHVLTLVGGRSLPITGVLVTIAVVKQHDPKQHDQKRLFGLYT